MRKAAAITVDIVGKIRYLPVDGALGESEMGAEQNFTLWHTAIHEAGHAVALSRFDREQGDVSIHPDPEEGSLGRAFGEGLNHIWNEEDARQIAVADAAGYAALIAHGMDEDTAMAGAWDDFENVETIVRDWLPGTTVEEWKAAAVDLMREPPNVRAVNLIATDLMNRGFIRADHLWVLIDLADGECTEEEFREYLRVWRLDCPAKSTT